MIGLILAAAVEALFGDLRKLEDMTQADFALVGPGGSDA